MSKTILEIRDDKFLINGKLTYSTIPGTHKNVHGLLMNARFIQGIFDDKADPKRFNRFGYEWDPEANTDRLIEALPEWKKFGLLGFTVGFQGGMPVITIENETIDNNPFGEDGKSIDPAYLRRMDKLIKAADDIGMIVIVSLLYQGQVNRFKDSRAIVNAVKTGSRFLREGKYTNIILEVANEYNVGYFMSDNPIVSSPQGITTLIDIAREESGGLPTGASAAGLVYHPEVARASDVILVHGNTGTEQSYYDLIKSIKDANYNKPILCNEDSPRFTQLKVAVETGTSWGYYNTHTKQEPPADWSITKGEDQFFAWRMADLLGIPVPEIPYEEQFYFQGFEKDLVYENQRWLRLASLFPEKIDTVKYYRNGQFFDIAFEEPYYPLHVQTWIQKGIQLTGADEEWRAEILLHSGKVIERKAYIRNSEGKN
ncbi:hypothetical protein [uncultured Sphaerochaeta sp.]|uniref:hypothetical protein n=1 Tax=uncultured Sphaerochaeta sp. TaxID=886478 RepID=UPI002AA6E8D6|nr:hypothetical protein [uncultured Sphaerochaeta sp.]